MLRLLSVWDKLRASFWLVPGVMALAALALSIAAGYLDRALGSKLSDELSWLYSGGAEGARSVLSAIASSVMGVAGTTFSITTAVLSLTSGQFGPRLLRNFMRDLGNQIVLGTFTSTFLYCLLVLRSVRGTDDVTYVPHVSVTLGVLLAVLSVGVLIYFVHHVAESIQVSHLINEVGLDADAGARRMFPEHVGERGAAVLIPPGEPAVTYAQQTGYLGSVDAQRLLQIAEQASLVIRLEVRPGEYILPDMKLLSTWPAEHRHHDQLREVFRCDRQRTTMQDIEFAFLQMSEVAVRALSPGINDPFTAMMCIDRITASMCIVAPRAWPQPDRYGAHRVLRVIAKPHPPAALVDAAFGHIRHAARDAPAVLSKLRQSLTTLIERAGDSELLVALLRERQELG